MWNPKKKKKEKRGAPTNLFTKQKQIHRFREQAYGYQQERAGRRDRLGAWD